MQLIQDVFVIERLQVLNEGKNKGPMRIRGIFGRCNEKNNNGRIYPTKVLEGQIKKLEPLISERRLCGELDHPTNDSVKLSNASHLITKLEMKGNELIGEAEILNTPAGLTAKALIEGGVRIGISSRGMGTLSEDDKGDKIVNEDFNLVTFDLVADPSTRGAFPSLTESTQTKFVKNKLTKLQKESNFIKLLESKLRTTYTEEEIIQERRAPKAKKVKIKKEVFPEHSLYLNIGKLLSEDFSTEYEKELERMQQSRNLPSAPKSSGFLSDIAARRHARKMEIARAKGRVRAAGIEQKGAILRARRNDRVLQGKPTLKRDYAFLAAKKGANFGGRILNRASQDIPDAASRIGRGAKFLANKLKPRPRSIPKQNPVQANSLNRTPTVMNARKPQGDRLGFKRTGSTGATNPIKRTMSSLGPGPSRLSLNKGPDRPLIKGRPEQKRIAPAPERPLLGPGPTKKLKKPGNLPPEIKAGKRKGITKKPTTKNKTGQAVNTKPGLGRTKKLK